jgi:hypothetical protein
MLDLKAAKERIYVMRELMETTDIYNDPIERDTLNTALQQMLFDIVDSIMEDDMVMNNIQGILDEQTRKKAADIQAPSQPSKNNILCLYVYVPGLYEHVECLWRGMEKPKKYADIIVKHEDAYFEGVLKNIYHISDIEFVKLFPTLHQAYPDPHPERDEIEIAVIRLDSDNTEHANLWLHNRPIKVNDRAVLQTIDGRKTEGTIIYTYQVSREATKGFEADLYPIQ